MHIVTYDRRGHGRFDRPPTGYDIDTLADDLAAVIDRLDLSSITFDRSFHGNSGGCPLPHSARIRADRPAGAEWHGDAHAVAERRQSGRNTRRCRGAVARRDAPRHRRLDGHERQGRVFLRVSAPVGLDAEHDRRRSAADSDPDERRVLARRLPIGAHSTAPATACTSASPAVTTQRYSSSSPPPRRRSPRRR
jgi:hypothetical protein